MNTWTRISAGEVARQHRGCVLRVTRTATAWTWTSTHTTFTLNGSCCTLHQAQVASVRQTVERLSR